MQIAKSQRLLQLRCIKLSTSVCVYSVKPCAQLLLLGVHAASCLDVTCCWLCNLTTMWMMHQYNPVLTET